MSHTVGKPIYREDPKDYDCDTVTIRIRANKLYSKRFLSRRGQQRTIKALITAGVLQDYGCDCSHYLNDWDCCGRMTVSWNEIKRTTRGVLIIQHRSRNI